MICARLQCKKHTSVHFGFWRHWVGSQFSNDLTYYLFPLTLKITVVSFCFTSLNKHKLGTLPTHCIYVFCTYFRNNLELWPKRHSPTCFFLTEMECLLRGRNWVLNISRFVLEWLMTSSCSAFLLLLSRTVRK